MKPGGAELFTGDDNGWATGPVWAAQASVV